jgi:type VI protein secretion system component VasF
MRGSSFRARRRRDVPVRLVAAGVAAVIAVAALFWFSYQAEQSAPEPSNIEAEARNVAPQ